MGNPVNDKTITSHHGYMGALERDRLADRLGLGNHDFLCNFNVEISKTFSVATLVLV